MKNSLYAIVTKFGVRLIGLLSIMVMARLLTPEDFGIVAPAVATLAIFEAVAISGIKQMIVRQTDLSDSFVNTGWTIGIIVNGALAILMIVFAGPLLEAYTDIGGIWSITSAVALYLVIDSFENPGLFLLERTMQFGKIMNLRISARVIAAFVTIGSAVILGDYRALIVGVLAYQIILTVLSYAIVGYRPRVTLLEWRRYTKPSLLMTSSNAMRNFTFSGERLTLGSTLAIGDLGFLSVGRDIVRMMMVEIASALNDVILPTLMTGSDNKNGDDEARRLKTMIVSGSLLAVPMGIGLSWYADPIVALILGDQWAPIVGWVQVLAIGGIYMAISEIGVIALVALHAEKRNALADLLHFGLFCSVLGFVMMTGKSVYLLVVLFSALQVLTCVVRLQCLLPFMKVSWIQLIIDHFITLLSAAAMTGTLFLLERFLKVDGEMTLILIPPGMIIYFTVLYALVRWMRRGTVMDAALRIFLNVALTPLQKKTVGEPGTENEKKKT